VADPLRARALSRRAAKRREQPAPEEPTSQAAPLVSQEARSEPPPARRGPATADDLIRLAAFEARGRVGLSRIE
jgi:hypothetical protein